MNEELVLRGVYTFVGGRLQPDEGMRHINEKLKTLKMLAGSTETTQGEFYYDEADGTYWHFVQAQNYASKLSRTTRPEIERDYPHIGCDSRIEVSRR